MADEQSIEQVMQQVQVVEDGQEVIRPDVLQFLMQAAQLAQLVKLRKLEERKVPTATKSFSTTVTDTTLKLVLGTPWISFTVINDGPNGVYVEVNDETALLDRLPINSGESYEVDMQYPVIQTVYLRAVTGGTAAIRIKAKW